MRPAAATLAAAWAVASPAMAGPWGQAAGQGQIIIKYEQADASRGFDATGTTVVIPRRVDRAASVYFEYGLNERFTLQGKAVQGWGEDAGVTYSGFGGSELGVRTRLFGGGAGVVSLYTGVTFAGDGRNAGYAAPGVGRTGGEVRLLAGRSGEWSGRHYWVEGQVAALRREGLPDERRLDLTAGLDVSEGWTVMAQTYSGQAGSARWTKGELSLIRNLGGNMRLQAGWRWPINGRMSPREAGPAIGFWRNF